MSSSKSGGGYANTLPSGVVLPSGFADVQEFMGNAEKKDFEAFLRVLKGNAENMKERIRATRSDLSKLMDEKKTTANGMIEPPRPSGPSRDPVGR